MLSSSSSSRDSTPILNLPLEIVGLILNALDFDSVKPFLDTYPSLKKHVLIITNRKTKRPFFNIEGVRTLTELPVWMKHLKDRNTLLTLYNLTPEDYHDYFISPENHLRAFTALVFDRLMRGPNSVFIHSILYRETPYNPVYQSFMKKLAKKGLRIRERIEEGFEHLPLSNLKDTFSFECILGHYRSLCDPVDCARPAVIRLKDPKRSTLAGFTTSQIAYSGVPGDEGLRETGAPGHRPHG